MMDNLEKIYEKFADNGIKGITEFIGKNNYTENLTNELLSLHIDKINFMISFIKNKNSTYNNLFDLLSDYPEQIKFNNQLLKHRENPVMNLCFRYCISTLKPITIPLFKDRFGLSEKIEHYDSVWMTMIELWHSKLDVNNITAKHMKEISEETAKTIIKLNNN